MISKSWFTIQEAAEKFGIDPAVILEWVNEGLVRTEGEGEQVMQVNGDDIELKLEERVAGKEDEPSSP